MKRLFTLLAAALCCAPPLLAQDSYVQLALDDIQTDPAVLFGTSLQFESSFGLLYESFDYAATNPADLALLSGDEATRYLGRPATREGEAHLLYTNLYNFGETNALQLAAVFAAGPGNLAVAAGHQRLRVRSTTRFTDFVSSVSSESTLTDDDKSNLLHLAYGWSVGDAGRLGLSYTYAKRDTEGDSHILSIASNNESTFKIQELAAAWRGDPSERISYNIAGRYVKHDTSDFDFSADRAGFAGLDLGGTYFRLDARLDRYYDDYDLEFFAGWMTGNFDPDNAILQDDPFDDLNGERHTLLSADFSHDSLYGGLRYLRRRGKTDLAAGLTVFDDSWDLALRYDRADAFAPDTPFSREGEANKIDTLAIALPIVVRYHFTGSLSVTAGAQFDYLQSDDTLTFDSSDPIDPGMFHLQFISKIENDATSADYRVALRYEATDTLTGELLFATTSALVGGRGPTAAIDASMAAVSVAMHW